MKNLIFKTSCNYSGVIARLFLGLVLFHHGAQKLLGWFGGYGFSGTMGFFTEQMHLPWIIAFLTIMIEFFGSLCLIFGFASRFWAACITILMLGIIFTVHIHNGFFMNWFQAVVPNPNDATKFIAQAEGYEYHLLAIGLALSILFSGSGCCSLDRMIVKDDSACCKHPEKN
ncbi:MAG: DoxX family protein [Limnohabitans sp.]|nr:DoxX family protein [Limnohabitans sp.]